MVAEQELQTGTGLNGMGQYGSPRVVTKMAVLALTFALGCKLEEELLPTGSSGGGTGDGSGTGGGFGTGGSSLTAPIIADPLPGSTVSEDQPSLEVLNAGRNGGEAPTYLFQVSTESSFGSLTAQSPLVPEDPSGSTSWEIDRPLDEETTYYWRARARSGTVESEFSTTAEFTISASTDLPPPPAGTVIADPLLGGSIGEVSGGQFTSSGWRVTSPADYIRYEVPPISDGWVEFETSGLRPVNPSNNQFMLFGMWDPTLGPYRANPFRVHLQKLHPNPHNPPYLRLRWIARGEQHDEGSNFDDWDPLRTYSWRIEWGPVGQGHRVRVSLDGDVEIEVDYTNNYRPNVHFIELGIAERGESVVGTTYSNLRIGN